MSERARPALSAGSLSASMMTPPYSASVGSSMKLFSRAMDDSSSAGVSSHRVRNPNTGEVKSNPEREKESKTQTSSQIQNLELRPWRCDGRGREGRGGGGVREL